MLRVIIILINGSPSGFFSSSCGLRYKNPLLLLLFVVVKKALSRMMTAIVDKRLLSGFLVGSWNNEDLLVFHLLFVDDTLIFCETNSELLRLVRCILCFEAVLGLKINLKKHI